MQMTTLQEKSAQALIRHYHPTSAREVVGMLRQNGYPTEILDLVRSQAPLTVLANKGKGIYEMVHEDGHTLPSTRLVYHADEARLSSIEVKQNDGKWHLQLLNGMKPKSVLEAVQKRFPTAAILRYRKAIPDTYLVLSGKQVKMQHTHQRSLQTVPTKQTFSEDFFINGPFCLLNIVLHFHGYKVKLLQDGHLTIGTKRSGFVSQVFVDLARGRFRGSIYFSRTDEQKNFRIDSADIHVLNSSDVRARMDRESDDYGHDDDFYYDDDF